jgi:hypothetical protein
MSRPWHVISSARGRAKNLQRGQATLVSSSGCLTVWLQLRDCLPALPAGVTLVRIECLCLASSQLLQCTLTRHLVGRIPTLAASPASPPSLTCCC